MTVFQVRERIPAMTRTAVPPVELEQLAERAVRRGELLAALEHFEAFLAQQPDDERVRTRMESVRALLQPSELVSRRRSEPDVPHPSADTLSDAEAGEMHASSGRFDEAATSYERALLQSPNNELLRERLTELRALARPIGKADMGGAEKLAPITTPPRAAEALTRSAKVSEASYAPMKPRAKDPVQMLKALLERVRSGRKKD
jgi:tetratricopeptide (TPR) repeat protein